jgi:hypothetical protein
VRENAHVTRASSPAARITSSISRTACSAVSPGRVRRSSWSVHEGAYVESPTPPSILEEWSDAGPTRGWIRRLRSFRSNSSSAATIRPIFEIALTPRSQRLPCAARPSVRTSIHAKPLWAVMSFPSLPSVRTHPSARWRRTKSSAPRLAYSSSQTSARRSVPRGGASESACAAARIAATPPFMSKAPRP